MACEEDGTDGASGSAMLQMARKRSPVKASELRGVSKDEAGQELRVLKEDHASLSHAVQASPVHAQSKEESGTPPPTIQHMIQEGFDNSVSMPWGHLPAKQAYRQTDELSSFKGKTGPSGQKHHPKPGLHGSVSNQRCGLQALVEVSKAHLNESSSCLPDELPHKHLSAIRRGASLLGHLLATDTKNLQLLQEMVPAAAAIEVGVASEEAAAADEVDGASAPLNDAGFKAVTSRCCPQDMEIFFQRLLEAMSLKMCSKPHVQGLMHWFTCAPDMEYQYLVDVINNGNPCKYWTAEGGTCPALSPECEGEWCR